MTTKRHVRISDLKNSPSAWDNRTAEYMEQDPTITQGRAAAAAREDLVHEMDELWRAEQDEPKRPTYWGDDPEMLAIVGLN